MESHMFKLPWSKAGSAGPAGPAPEAVPAAPAPPAGGTHDIFVARQPIFTPANGVHGYELLFRSGRENRFTAADPEMASAVNIEQSMAAFGLDALVGDRLAFVNLSRGALVGELYRALPPERTVIELLETVEPDDEVLAACRRLRSQGYQLALDDFTHDERTRPLLDVANIVKMDFRSSPASLDRPLLDDMRRRGLALLAEKIETREEQRRAAAAGYVYFQGYYFCRPQMIETRDLPPSKLAYLRFLAEVNREDASFERLEDVFRADVGLTVRLLRYLNSAAFGWRHEVPTLRHALALMGLSPLRKWATMMGLLALNDGGPPELAVTALTRGRFAEQLGPPAGLRDQGIELFLAGMLSLVDAMVGRPAAEILPQLALPGDVSRAVLAGEAPLGSVLHVVEAYERGDWSEVETTSAANHLDERTLSDAYVSSLQWAEATAAA
jgi:EAL and modified HD-GYP domain-containing signal transduction protein